MFFLSETRLSDLEMDSIRVRCGIDFYLGVSCSGEGRARAGGLALLGKESLNLSITSFSKNHLAAKSSMS